MKRILFLICFITCLYCNISAEQNAGYCKIAGTINDYVQATANLNAIGGGTISGNIIISNSSSKPLMSLHIYVTAEVETFVLDSRNGNHNEWNTVTIYNSYYTKKIPAYSSESINVSCDGNKIRNISVTVSNATCN